jgi:hypothetical protein
MLVGVFVDTSNLYYCINKKWEGRKLDYEKYLEHILLLEQGEVSTLQAFGLQLNKSAKSFITNLKFLNFDTFFTELPEKTNVYFQWDAGITARIISSKVDTVILGSTSRNLVPAIEVMRSIGLRIVIFAAGIPRTINDVASRCVEIPESCLIPNEI